MKRLTMILLVIVLALATATGYLGYRLSEQQPGLGESLFGTTPAQAKVIDAMAPVLSFTPEAVLGEVPGTINDDLGRKVYIENIPTKIVCMNPAAAEVLFLLGEDERLVGVSDAWLYWIKTPEELVTKIKNKVEDGQIKTFSHYPQFGISPDPEAILALEPGIVFSFGYTLPEYAKALEATGVPVIAFAADTLGDVLRNVVLIGKVVGKEDEAAEIAKEMRERMLAIGTKTIVSTKPSIFYEVWYDESGLWTAGSDSFISSLICLAGGEDIGTVVPSANPKIDPEYVIGSDPEIFILADAPLGAEAPQAILPAERSGWGNLTAVKEGKVYRLTEEEIDRISRPGPGLVDGLETLVKIIHPELFE